MAVSSWLAPVTLQQLDQGRGNAAEIAAALGSTDQQDPAGRRRLRQPIGRSMAMCLTFVRHESLDMGLALDLLALAVAARMRGNDLLTFDDAQPIDIGQHGQGSQHVGVRHRVIVFVEANVGCLPTLTATRSTTG